MALDLSFGGTAFPRAAEVRRLLYDNACGGMSTRFRVLDRLDAFARCAEYDHQTTDWNGRQADALETISPSAVLPYGYTQPALGDTSIRERRPTAPARLVPTIIGRFSDLLFSENKIPWLSVEGDEDADDFVRAVFDTFGFWVKFYEARGYGGAMGSSLLMTSLQNGRFKLRPFSPKVVQDIVWEDRDQLIPAGVLIQYETIKSYEVLDERSRRPTGEIREVPFCYRRIIDEERDIVFKEKEMGDDGKPPQEMEIDQRASVMHGLGRFPGCWVQNLPRSDVIDGEPDAEGIFQMVDSADRLNSQANFALMANMDPTLILSRDPKMRKMGGGGSIKKGSRDAIDVGLQGSANYLEFGAAAIGAARELAKDFRQQALDKSACILPGQEEQAAAQSAKAIEYRFAPMLSKAGRLRTQWGAAVKTIAEIVLELSRKWGKPESYAVNARPTFALPHRVIEMDADPDNPDVEPIRTERIRHPGKGGTVVLEWGDYFAPTPADTQQEVTTLVAAKEGGLIDQETAIKRAAPHFGVRDTRTLYRKVQEEAAEKDRKQADMMAGLPLGGMQSDLAADYAQQGQQPPPPPPSAGGNGEERPPPAGQGGFG